MKDTTPAACDTVHAHSAKLAIVRRHLIDGRAGGALADIFKVLGDPTRVRLLHALALAELCVCDLAALVGSSESAVSHQLRLLRSLRVVRARRAGRMVFYALDDEHVIGLLEQGLRHVEEDAEAVPQGGSRRVLPPLTAPRASRAGRRTRTVRA